MRTSGIFTGRLLFASIGLGLVLCGGAPRAEAATKYWDGAGTWDYTTANWGTASGGPYTSLFVANDAAVFDVAASTITGGTVAFSAITANQNVTFTAGGTLATGGTMAPITVASGMTLNLAGQSISTAVGTGLSKSGDGTLALANGNAYPGGFTLNAGTITVGGVNAMGDGGTLTINGGVIQSTATRLLVAKYDTGIVIGGNFGFAGSGVLQFNNNVSLGASTRVITNTCSAPIVWAGTISGSAGSGLTFTGSGGTFILTGTNTFTGDLTINGGSVKLATNGSVAAAANIVIGGGATCDVSTLTTALTMASGQGLRLTGASGATGTVQTTTSKGLTTASATPITFTAYNGSKPPLYVNGASSVTLAAGNCVTVTVSNSGTPLASATRTYKLIAIGNGNTTAVAGTAPSTVVVNGDGASGTASLEIYGGELYLNIAAASTPSITLADNGTQVAAAGVVAGTTAHILHKFSLAVATANATLTGVSFTSAGTYAAADISNFKVWYSTDNSLSTGSDTLLGTISSSLGTGSHSLSSLSQAINSGSTGYIFITTDIAASPTAGNTINVSAITTSDVTFSAGDKSGSTTAGGSQTILVAASISAQPAATYSGCAGSAVNLTVTAAGTSPSYAWRKRGAGWGSSWSITAGGGGVFIGNNQSSIDTSSKAWGMWNNGGTTTEATRNFTAMPTGHVFYIEMDNASVASGGSVGFSLQNSSGTSGLEVYFQGGDSNYTINRNGGEQDSGIGYTTAGLLITITNVTTTTYSMAITVKGGSTYNFTGTYMNSVSSISRVRVFNYNANSGGDFFVNNLKIGPFVTCPLYDDTAAAYSSWSGDLGNGPLSNGGDISGATSATLTISNLETADNGTYDVVVYNPFGGATSSSANGVLTVNALPTITLGSNPSVCGGTTTANLTYSGTTGDPDKYSINFDATAEGQGFADVSLATLSGSPIAITVPAGAAAGTYNGTLTVKDDGTGCESSGYSISVTVSAAPTITLGTSPTVCAGTTSASLPYSGTTGTPTQYKIDYDATAEAAGFSDVAYTAMPGSSPVTLTVPGGASAATYNATITVKNATGCESSATAFTVTVSPTGDITGQPSSASVCIGSSANLTVTATGGSLTYAWRKRGAGWGTSGSWSYTAGNGGTFVGSSSEIDTSSKAWAMWNDGATATEMKRDFTALAVNDIFQIEMDNGSINSGGIVGFSLRNSSDQNMVEFYFQGGESNYNINGSGGETDTGAGWTDAGLRITVTITSATTYSVSVYRFANTTTYGPFTGSFINSGSISRIRLFAQGSGGGANQFFNSMKAGGTSSTAALYDDTAAAYSSWSGNLGQGPLANGATGNGSTNSGVSTASFTISNFASADAGDYDVVVYNSCGGETSTAATLTANALPTITLGSNPSVCAGTTTANLTYSGTTGLPDKYSINFDATAEGQGFSDVSLATLSGSPIAITVPGGAAAGTYNGVLTVKDDGTGCTSGNYNITVTVTALPTITLGASPSVTEGTTSANLPYTGTSGSPTHYRIDYDATAQGEGFSDVSWTALGASPIALTVPGAAAPAVYNGTIYVSNSTTTCESSGSAFTVTISASSVDVPAAFSVAPSAGSMELTFTRNAANNDVIIVYDLDGSFSAPSGAAPDVGDSFAGGTVVYKGGTSPQTHANLAGCTHYYYKIWSYSGTTYSSSGLTDDDTTATPSAPTGFSVVTNTTEFTASWTASAGATNYYIDVATNSAFQITDSGYSTLFFEGFETGDASNYTANADCSLSTANPNTGTTALKMGGAKNDVPEVTFDPVSIPSGASATVTVSFAVTLADAGEDLGIELRTWNGSGVGATNSSTLYTGTGGTAGYFTSNLTVAASSTQVVVRVYSALLSANGEYYELDDVYVKEGHTPTSVPAYIPGYSNRLVGGTASMTVTGLTASSTYYYRVRAEGAGASCISGNSTTQTVVTAVADVTGPTISNFGVTNATGTTVYDKDWSSFNIYVNLADAGIGLDWDPAPTWALTNPANAEAVAANAFVTTGHTTGEASTTATDTVSGVTFAAGTWKVGVWAQDAMGNASGQAFSFTAVDDDTNAPSLGGASSDYGVYYNLPDGEYTTEYPGEFDIRDRIIDHLDLLSNGDTGTLSTYTWSGTGDPMGCPEPILNAVSNALARGASVRFIVDDGVDQSLVFGANSIDSLEARPGNALVVSADDDATGIMHHKFAIFDYGPGDRWVFVPSANYTEAACSDQWNMGVDIRSDDLYAAYLAEAVELLAGRFHDHVDKSHAHDNTTFSLQGSWSTNWVRFSPPPDGTYGGNNPLRDITNEIAQADSEIYFALNSVTRQDVADRLVALCDANPSIQIHGAIAEDAYTTTDWDLMYAFLTNSANYSGTNRVHFHAIYEDAARTTPDSGTVWDLIHGKWMVIDPFGAEPRAIHGSANWSASGLVTTDVNDESVLFLRHGGIASQMFEQWTIMTGVFTDRVQTVASGAAMTVYAGTESATYQSGSTTNTIWTVDYNNLLTNTLSLVFSVYDYPDGINRGTDTAATNLNVTVENLCTDNVTNFVLSLSSAICTNSSATSVWKFVNFNAGILDSMVGTNAVTLNIPDGDCDRTDDSTWRSNQQVGYLCIPTPSGPPDPAFFYVSATNMTQLDLAFKTNASGNSIVIVYDLDNTFTTPSGAPGNVGDAFAGGTIVYKGTGTSTSHTGLTACTPYYYKAWSYTATPLFSTGLTASATTLAPAAPATLWADPTNTTSFTANWSASTGATGYRLDVSTNATFGTTGGESAATNCYHDGTIGNGTGGTWEDSTPYQASGYMVLYTTDVIVTPAMDFTGSTSETLNFKARTYGGAVSNNNTITVSISTNNGSTWTSIGTRTPTTTTLTSMSPFDLSSYNHAQVKVKFEALLATAGIGAGIDDILITNLTSGTVSSYVPGYSNLAVAATSQSVTGLTSGVTYYYRVRAESSGSCVSGNSTTASVITVAGTPYIALADNGTQVAAGSVTAGSTANILHQFQLTVTNAATILTGVGFTSAGTYAAADLSNFKVWYSANNTLETGSDTLLGTISSSLGAGAHSLSSLTQVISSDSTGYVFITADIAAGATAGNGINVSAVATGDLTFSSGNKSGSTTAGGTQTIVVSEPTTHASSLSFSAVGMTQMTISWTSGNGSSRIVVVHEGTATSWTPTDGTAPSGVNTNFSSATDQGSGNKICYDGSGSSFTLTGLSAGTTYYVTVFEYNGTGTYVNYYTGGTPLTGSQMTTCADAPASVWANPTNSTSFTANWSASTGASTYRLDVSTNSAFGTTGSGTILNEGFDTLTDTSHPSGWTGSRSSDLDYAILCGVDCPSYKLQAVDQWLKSPVFAAGATNVQLYTAGNGGSASVISVSGLVSGVWTRMGAVTNAATGANYNIPLSSSPTQLLFVMEVKVVNSSLDDIVVTGTQTTPTYVAGYSNRLVSSGTSLDVTGLVSEVTYYFRVRSEGGSCTSGNSPTGSVTTIACVTPDVPTGLYANPTNTYDFTANWAASAGAASYLIDVSTNSDFTGSVGGAGTNCTHPGTLGGGTGGTWTETGLTESSGYLVFLQADELITPQMDFTDSTSETLNFKARTYGTVNATYNTITVSISTNNGSTWDVLGTRVPASSTLTAMTPFDLSSYNHAQVKVKFAALGATTASGAGIDDVIITNLMAESLAYVAGYSNRTVGATSVSVTGLLDQVTYYYRVKAVAAAGCSSGYSVTASVTTVVGPPPTPTGLEASDGTYASYVGLSWTDASTKETGFVIWRNTENTFATSEAIYTNAANAASYNDTSAAFGTTYYYWITATNAIGSSSESLSDSGYRGLAAVTVAASDGTYGDKVVLTWDDVAYETGYGIWRNTVEDTNTMTFLASAAADATSYDDTTAEPLTNYYYWVRATNSSAGIQGYLDPNGEPGYRGLAAPTVTASDSTDTGKIVVQWNDIGGETAYGIWRSETDDTNTASFLSAAAADATSYDDGDTVPGVTYYYWVAATNGTLLVAGSWSTSDAGMRRLVVDPTATLTEDGREMVRAAVTANASNHNIMVLWTNVIISADPVMNSTYNEGDSVGNARVIYKGAATNFREHVVLPASTNRYKIFSVDTVGTNIYYSAGMDPTGSPLATRLYQAGVAVETFSYTNVALNTAGFALKSGGAAWASTSSWVHSTNSTSWLVITNDTADGRPMFFTAASNMPDLTGNRIFLDAMGSTRYGDATRSINTTNSGAIYVCALAAYRYNGTDKWLTLAMMNGATEEFEVGKVWGADKTFSIRRSGGNATSSATMEPYNDSTNNWYWIVLKYDFATGGGTAYAKCFTRGQGIPTTEPSTWDATWGSMGVAQFTAIRLKAGNDSNWLGGGLLDEVRVSSVWPGMIGEPDLVITPASMNYGNVETDRTEVATFWVQNTGGDNVPLVVSSITLGGTNPTNFSLSTNGLGTIEYGQSNSFTVTFLPNAIASFSATLYLTNNSGVNPTTVALSGAGIASSATNPPVVDDYVVGVTNQVTDAMVTSGVFSVVVEAYHSRGLSNNATYDLLNASSTVILTNQSFESFTSVNGRDYVLSNATHAGYWPGTPADNYSVRVYLASSNGVTSTNTTHGSGEAAVAPDLFISEYIEGGGNNKAIEIFNGTGASVDLGAGNYALRIYANGSVTPSTTIYLTGTVANAEVFVVANSGSVTGILGVADMVSGSLTHNGDDAVSLAKNSVNLDVVGTIGDPAAFGANVTLVRTNTVSEGTTTYETWQWTSYASDTVDYLGSHTMSAVAGQTMIFQVVDDDTNAPAIANPFLNGTTTPSGSASGPSISIDDIAGANCSLSWDIQDTASGIYAASNAYSLVRSNVVVATATATASTNGGGKAAAVSVSTSIAKTNLTWGEYTLSLLGHDYDVEWDGDPARASNAYYFVIAAPNIVVAPISLDFGSVTRNESSNLTVTVQNTGNAALSISSIGFSGTGSGYFTVLPSSGSVPAGGATNLTVIFAPTAGGAASVTMTINNNTPNNPAPTVSIVGDCNDPATENPRFYDFTAIDSQAVTNEVTDQSVATGGVTVNFTLWHVEGMKAAGASYDLIAPDGTVVWTNGTFDSMTATNIGAKTCYLYTDVVPGFLPANLGVYTGRVTAASSNDYSLTDETTVTPFTSGQAVDTVLDGFSQAYEADDITDWMEVYSGPLAGNIQVTNNYLQFYGAGGLQDVAGRLSVVQDLSASGRYNTVLTNNSDTLRWGFNFVSGQNDCKGFLLGQYGAAFVLGCDSTNWINGTGNGYAVRISSNEIALVHFNSGLNGNGDFTTIGTAKTIEETNAVAVKVELEPSTGVWSLYVKEWGGTSPDLFSSPVMDDMTLITTAADTTYLGTNDLMYVGCQWNHGTALPGTGYRGVFDDVYVPYLQPVTIQANFTVVDEDEDGPVHSSFSINDKTFETNTLQTAGGLAVTGLVSDINGVYGGTSNVWTLFSNGTEIATGSMVMNPSANGSGTTNSPAALTNWIAFSLLNAPSFTGFVFQVVSTDYDTDRPGDSASTTNQYQFYVIAVAPPCPTSVTATPDGMEMVEMGWNKNGASDVIVLWNTNPITAGSLSPAINYTANMTTPDGSLVAYRGTNASGADLVVPEGAASYFRVFGAAGSSYSATYAEPTNNPATTFEYEEGEVVDQFAYTNSLYYATATNFVYVGGQAATGQGWDGPWAGDTNKYFLEDDSLAGGVSGYPEPYANKLKWIDTSTESADSATVTRKLATPRNATVFIAFIMNYQYDGTEKWMGLSLMSGDNADTEEIFFGKLYGYDKTAGINDEAMTTATASSFSMEPGHGNDYIIVGELDPSAKTVKMYAYYTNSVIPQVYANATPIATYSNASTAFNPITGIRLSAGSSATSGKELGHLVFDEVRVGGTWDEVLNFNFPDATYYTAGTVINGTNYVTDGELSETGKGYEVSFETYHRSGVTNATFQIVTNLDNLTGLYPTNVILSLDPTDADPLDRYRTFTNMVTNRLDPYDVVLGVYTSRVWMESTSGKETNTLFLEGMAGASDLFFGEFGEGQWYNKYVEIYNGSGSARDLSQYWIASQTTPANKWVTWQYWCRLAPTATWLEHGQTMVILNGETANYPGGLPSTNLAAMTNALIAAGRPYLITTNNILSISGDDPVGLFAYGEKTNWIDTCGIAPDGGTGERYIMSRLEDAEVPRSYPLQVDTNQWDYRDWEKTTSDGAAFTNFIATAGAYDRLVGMGGYITFTVIDDDEAMPRVSLAELRPTNGVLARWLFTSTASTAPTLVDAANAEVGTLGIEMTNGSFGTPTFVTGPTGGTYAASASGWAADDQFFAVDVEPVYVLSLTGIAFQAMVSDASGPTAVRFQQYSSNGTLMAETGDISLGAAGSWSSASSSLSGFDMESNAVYQLRLRAYGAASNSATLAIHNLTLYYQSTDTNSVTMVTDAEFASGSYQVTGNAWDEGSGLTTTNAADTTKWPVISLYAPNGSVAVSNAALGMAAGTNGGARTEGSGAFSNSLPRPNYANLMMGAYTGLATLWDYDTDRTNDQTALNANLAMYVVDNDIQPPSAVGTIRVNGIAATTNTPDRYNVSWGNTPEFLVTFDTVAADVDPGASYPDKQRVVSGIGEYRVAATNVSAMTASNRAAYGTPYPVATTNGALANYGFEMWQVGWTYDANCTFHYAGLSGDTNAAYEGTNCLKQSNGGVAYQTIEFRNLAATAPLVGVSGRYMSTLGATFLVEAFSTNDLVNPVATNSQALASAASWTSFSFAPVAVGNGTVEVLKISLKDNGGNTTYWDDLRLSVDIGTNLPSMRFVAGVENQGLLPQYLFAVDADNNRAGDKLAGTSMPFYIAYDITPPTDVTGLDTTTESVDDPTTQFDLQWSTTGVGPDDETHVNHPTGLATDRDLLSPWQSYKIYYGTFNPLDVPVGDPGPGFASAYIYTNFIETGVYTNWTYKASDSTIADPSATGTNYLALTNLTQPSIRLYDLDFDQDYAIVIVGVDKAGNEGPAMPSSWATNNTIRFALIRGKMLPKDTAAAAFPSATLANTNVDTAAAMYWIAAGQTNSQGGYDTVTKDYDLIFHDAPGFSESTNNIWNLIGTVRTNWFVDDGGQFRGRGMLRFYRASYKDRWKTTNELGVAQRPLASEEVYALHNVVLSGGQNFIALHGRPFTNTFFGVFGGLENFPGGSSALPASGATLVEFYAAGTNAPTVEQYYLNLSGQWVQVGGGDVTTNLMGSNFFNRGFSINLPKPLPTNYATTVAYDYSQLDTNGSPVQVPAMIWSPIAQVPTNAFSQTIYTGNRSGRVSTLVYNVAALRLPIAAHPSQMKLLECGFVNGARGASDEIYTMNTATKSVLSGSTIYCDISGVWRFVTTDALVPAGYFKPNDVIVIVSRNSVAGGSWTWTYHPGQFYALPTRWMGF